MEYTCRREHNYNHAITYVSLFNLDPDKLNIGVGGELPPKQVPYITIHSIVYFYYCFGERK